MKFIIAFAAIAFVALVMVPTASAKTCSVNCNTYSTTNVCGRVGTTCRRFSNLCNKKLYNCMYSATYATTSLSRCRSISVGSSGTCLSSTSSSAIYIPNALSGYNSGYSNSGVTPIVIRV